MQLLAVVGVISRSSPARGLVQGVDDLRRAVPFRLLGSSSSGELPQQIHQAVSRSRCSGLRQCLDNDVWKTRTILRSHPRFPQPLLIFSILNENNPCGNNEFK